jgi:CHAT domain-containing protein
MAPLENVIEGARRLVLVADSQIAALPFAALLQEDGRFLVESYEILATPSAASYSALAERIAEAQGRTHLRVLVLGAPSVEGDPMASELPPLPGAAHEAREVAALHPGATLLLGDDARRDELMQRAPAYDVIHIAAHAVANPANPQGAHLRLAPATPGDSGALAAMEIATLSLPRAPLVVLSACNTRRGVPSSLEGPLDLARPFLAAGAGSVIASLWAVDDSEARTFFNAFHRSYVHTGDAAASLRRAQLDMLASPDARLRHPAAWAAYQIVGASAESHNLEIRIREVSP